METHQPRLLNPDWRKYLLRKLGG